MGVDLEYRDPRVHRWSCSIDMDSHDRVSVVTYITTTLQEGCFAYEFDEASVAMIVYCDSRTLLDMLAEKFPSANRPALVREHV